MSLSILVASDGLEVFEDVLRSLSWCQGLVGNKGIAWIPLGHRMVCGQRSDGLGVLSIQKKESRGLVPTQIRPD